MKQIERIKNKIAQIRKELAADKKRWGGYRDFVEKLTQIDIALDNKPVGKRRSELVNKRYRLVYD